MIKIYVPRHNSNEKFDCQPREKKQINETDNSFFNKTHLRKYRQRSNFKVRIFLFKKIKPLSIQDGLIGERPFFKRRGRLSFVLHWTLSMRSAFPNWRLHYRRNLSLKIHYRLSWDPYTLARKAERLKKFVGSLDISFYHNKNSVLYEFLSDCSVGVFEQ